MADKEFKRVHMWDDFSKLVRRHLYDYTYPQYGDYPKDQLTEWTLDDIKTTLKRYVNRMGNNARGEEDQLKDFLKIAHYAQTAYLKFTDGEKNYND